MFPPYVYEEEFERGEGYQYWKQEGTKGQCNPLETVLIAVLSSISHTIHIVTVVTRLEGCSSN